MNRDIVKQLVFNVVNKHFKTDVTSEETSLINDLGGTSIDEMEITLFLEDFLKIDDIYKSSSTNRIKNIKDLIDMICLIEK